MSLGTEKNEQDDAPARAVYRIDDLAHRSGATVRTIRAYQDRGLLPRPERRGRANVYSDAHLTRLRQIADLLDRGYTLASIKELLEAWDTGRGLGGVLGLAAEVEGPWTDEEAVRMSRAELVERFGGAPDETAVADAVEAAALVRRLKPLAQQTVDAELARAMRRLATRQLRRHLGSDAEPEPGKESRPVLIAASTIRAVENLVGPDQVAAFVTAAAEREVQSRTLDVLTTNMNKSR